MRYDVVRILAEFLSTPARVPLDGYSMYLRSSELEAVGIGLGLTETLPEPARVALPRSLAGMPPNDRAPAWELAVRHFGRSKPVAQAAAEIGMDISRAEALLRRFAQALAAPPAPEG